MKPSERIKQLDTDKDIWGLVWAIIEYLDEQYERRVEEDFKCKACNLTGTAKDILYHICPNGTAVKSFEECAEPVRKDMEGLGNITAVKCEHTSGGLGACPKCMTPYEQLDSKDSEVVELANVLELCISHMEMEYAGQAQVPVVMLEAKKVLENYLSKPSRCERKPANQLEPKPLNVPTAQKREISVIELEKIIVNHKQKDIAFHSSEQSMFQALVDKIGLTPARAMIRQLAEEIKREIEQEKI